MDAESRSSNFRSSEPLGHVGQDLSAPIGQGGQGVAQERGFRGRHLRGPLPREGPDHLKDAVDVGGRHIDMGGQANALVIALGPHSDLLLP